MGKRFAFLFFLLSLFVFGLGFVFFQKIQWQQQTSALKLNLKWKTLNQLHFLDKEQDALTNYFKSLSKQIEEVKSVSPATPKSYLVFDDLKLFQNQLNPEGLGKEKPQELLKKASIEKIFLKLLVFDRTDLSWPLYSKKEEDSELFKALDLENKKPFSQNNFFEKLKWQRKDYFLLFKVYGQQVFVAFLKNSYFRLDSTGQKRAGGFRSQRKNGGSDARSEAVAERDDLGGNNKALSQGMSSQLETKAVSQKSSSIRLLFSTFNKNQDRFFYNSHIQNSLRLISYKTTSKDKKLGFFENSNPKYITRKSKNTQTFYYLQNWEGSNLLFISQKKVPVSFFTAFIDKDRNFLFLVILFFLVFIFLFFVGYRKIMLFSQAYSFLKKSLINYSETGDFSEDKSNNSFLSFYRNRQEVLNEVKEQHSQDKEEPLQLQEFIHKELKKIKTKYPQLVLNEDFQTDLKMFGFQSFFRTIFKELLFNAIESMGMVKIQKIDLCIKEENQQLVLSVRDYGVGMKDPEKAFQMYYSTKSQLGVGLNLVQSIVSANQGELELIKKEEGTLALLRLPLNCFLKK